MNQFERATVSAISRHGANCTYIMVSQPTYDPNTSEVTSGETNYQVRMYKKQFSATQFSFPNLVGKENAMFYLCSKDITFVPKPQDKILFNSVVFQISTVQEYSAGGKVILYKLIASK